MPNWPAGTVTFLCADTAALRQRDGAATAALPSVEPGLRMRLAALAREKGGVVSDDTAGPGGWAVFALATDAVAVASALQQELAAAAGVRIALHTGAAQPGEAGLGSPARLRCACLRDIGHAGQILLSAATAELVRDALPAGATLRPLGSHRLRDLGRPEHVFQLLPPGLSGDFAPLRSMDELPHNLPVQLTSFIGRERELAELPTLLAEARWVTLTGPGGSGKTRLALQVAAAAMDTFPDGAWLVDLAPLRDPGLVAQAVAAALGLKEEAVCTPLDAALAFCRPRHLLLVLDNCEHLLTACATLAEGLLRAAPQLAILATSREAMAVSGETVWQVPPLALPDPRSLPPVAGLTQYAAVRLFIDRAAAVQPGFTVTNQNAPAVAQICHHLDGIPLAIELAAARVKGLGVEDITARLDQRFRLLTGGSRTARPRHQTLRAAVDWSHDLLAEPERALFRRLAVFAGGFTVEMAEAIGVGSGISQDQILDSLLQLVDKSLVLVEERAGETRYRMLETLRQYGEEKLQAAGEEESLRGRHRDWFLALAEQADPALRRWVDQRWLHRLGQEHDNLRAALQWSLQRGEYEPGLRLAGALSPFWFWASYFREGQRWLAEFLELVPPAPPAVQARARCGLGQLLRRLCAYGEAEAQYARALHVWSDLADPGWVAWTTFDLAGVARFRGDAVQAARLLEQSLDLAREQGDFWLIAASLLERGKVAVRTVVQGELQTLHDQALAVARSSQNRQLLAETLYQAAYWARIVGDYPRARQLTETGLAVSRELGDTWKVAVLLFNLGMIAHGTGDLARADGSLRESVDMLRALGDRFREADSLNGLGTTAQVRGEMDQAWTWLTESLRVRREIGDRWGVAQSLDSQAGLATVTGDLDRAARLFGAAAAIWDAVGYPSLDLATVTRREQHLSAARTTLGEERYLLLLAEGQGLSEAAAIEYALAGTPSSSTAVPPVDPDDVVPATAAGAAVLPTPQSAAGKGAHRSVGAQAGSPPAGLTAREVEIIGRVAEGLTDREVAARLFISPRTVDTHLRNIFSKVGVSNRAGLVAWAARHGLAGGE